MENVHTRKNAYTVAGLSIGASLITAALTRSRGNVAFRSLLSGLNTGITFSAFFLLRDKTIGPNLVIHAPLPMYAQKRRELGLKPLPKDDDYILNDLQVVKKMENVIENTLSGAIVGGFIRGLLAGPRSILSGALTLGLSAGSVQYLANTLFPAHDDGIAERQVDNRPFSQRFLDMIGIRVLSDEEQLLRLRLLRAQKLRRIKQLEEEIENEQQQPKDETHSS
ncbi:hypothetical protein DL96DRAFT_1710162 [Flagelloscypha sp. PMI_526]|nr:hypothetical protein DL96DRAFT_1710162 [Flagelloscypha sp. PMI_526]